MGLPWRTTCRCHEDFGYRRYVLAEKAHSSKVFFCVAVLRLCMYTYQNATRTGQRHVYIYIYKYTHPLCLHRYSVVVRQASTFVKRCERRDPSVKTLAEMVD